MLDAKAYCDQIESANTNTNFLGSTLVQCEVECVFVASCYKFQLFHNRSANCLTLKFPFQLFLEPNKSLV